MVFLTVITMF